MSIRISRCQSSAYLILFSSWELFRFLILSVMCFELIAERICCHWPSYVHQHHTNASVSESIPSCSHATHAKAAVIFILIRRVREEFVDYSRHKKIRFIQFDRDIIYHNWREVSSAKGDERVWMVDIIIVVKREMWNNDKIVFSGRACDVSGY